MTYRRLPSLVGLRSFEAAARHRSVTRAAGELAVTPGAVSRAVRALEEELGTALFTRGTAGLALTPAGEALFRAARDGLDRIAAGLVAMRHAAPRRRLRIGAYTLFASRWLIPRWNRLRERHPDLEIDLQTSADPLELVPGAFDAVIAVADSRPRPGLTMVPLVPIEMMPVCAPRLIGPDGFDWRKQPLLHSRQRPDDWARWLSAAGIRGVNPKSGPSFESIALALDAAAEGLGVALAIRALVGPDLAAGRVVAPHPFIRPTTRCFTLLHDVEREGDPALAALRNWLAEEAAPVSPSGEAAAPPASPTRTLRPAGHCR
ncbi:LysR substrate-binding domain-containing protein [Roseomonas xinghualingensis]|uniref:LysR substrate-binding domain-containing protein n=1 Tax=Roseomonas xinghualingensis TaxID=2986475 RepID=UPI0021F15612|nr:LysR substrate-binding domain-containing protein [Roseomonas sp. SXEYE001]MCV4209245.1 LysR substrate-binding domain-containing protein [Roseomonas sp. SXEYE001]